MLDITDLKFPINSNISAKIKECLCTPYQLFPHSIRVPGWKLQKNKWLAVYGYEGIEMQTYFITTVLFTHPNAWVEKVHVHLLIPSDKMPLTLKHENHIFLCLFQEADSFPLKEKIKENV